MKHSLLIPSVALLAVFIVSLSFGLATAGPLLYGFSSQNPIDPLAIQDQFDLRKQHGIFDNAVVNIEPSFLRQLAQALPIEITNVLGTSASEKRIEVDLSKQRLYAFEGERKVYDFPISSGLYGKTPTGEFHIWIKLRATRMTGGNKLLHTYYDLPNVPYTMFFANDQVPRSKGFGIHGTYWHNNFGHPMSHGCINMKTSEVQQLYYWATPDLFGKTNIRATPENPGTRLIIYGTAPTT